MKPIVLDYTQDNELFNKTAQEWAHAIEEAQRGYGLKSTQLRNFYDKVLELYEKSEKEPLDEVLPFVKMLNSKVAYALGRKLITHNFETLMTQCINQIQTKEQLKIFKLFFEAILGFYKAVL